jgi:heme exporter protein B
LFWQQYRIFLQHGLKAELADLERIISPVLFSVTMLLVFSFALGDVEPSMKAKVYLAQTFVTALLALQLSFSRIFEPDRLDRVFDQIRTYPISPTAWFSAKYSLVVLLGSSTLLPTIFFGAFLHQTEKQPLFSWSIVLVGMLGLAGLAAMGVLLATMTLKANSRQLLYPILYFPLTTPVLLAAVNASDLILQEGAINDHSAPWLWLLIGFDVIYTTLGVLLYPELVEEG